MNTTTTQENTMTETITPLATQARYRVCQDGERFTVQSVRSGFIYAHADDYDTAMATAVELAERDQADADLERHLSRSE